MTGGQKRRKPEKASRRSRPWLRVAAWALGGMMLVAGTTAGIGWWRYTMPGPLLESRAIVIPHGGYASTVAVLQQADALRSTQLDRTVFLAALRLTRHDGQIHAAELAFPAHASIRTLLDVLRHGKPVLHPLTIPEGLTASQILTIVNAAPFLTGHVEALEEGTVLPETYRSLRETDRTALIARMQQAMQREVERVWQGRDTALILTTPQQLVILASVVEKETGVASERPRIARVFLNRLARGMKLQSDPTTIYALTKGVTPLGRPLTHADLAVASPYNTYVSTGLPPTPICVPGTAALEAVAHPATGDDLYFVASGNGEHRFAVSLDDHNRNVRALRTLRGTNGERHPTDQKPAQ
nr:endolytic transglycosylase MltG [Acetobacter estunensis]